MPEFARNIAFIIGINNYQNGISRLQNAVNDAKKLIEILQEKHDYEVWVCLDEKATLNNLNNLLEQTLPQQVKPDDRLLFYFAGHGIALNGEDGPTGYLIPQDAILGDTQTYLPMTKLQERLEKLSCRHFLGILDCCFAGAFRWSSTRDLLTAPEVIHQERYDRFISDPAWQVITSAAYDQKALDAFNLNAERGSSGEHSPFAAALFEALEGGADLYPPAQENQPSGDGIITATELYVYLRDRIETETEKFNKRQTPGLWCLKKHDKGEYIFLTENFNRNNLRNAPSLDEREENNPYRGLKPYEKEHADLFFGRTLLTEKLCDFVNDRRLTVVLGASGSGKSSLVKAGLIPHLEDPEKLSQKQDLTRKIQAHQHKQQPWHILPIVRPGESPLTSLTSAFKAIFPPSSEVDFSEGLVAWSKQHPDRKILLVIDQLEELITLCRNESERKEFLTRLANALQACPNLSLILTLRSDFEPQFRDTALETDWKEARFIVPAMTREELREVIEEPASAKVVFFKPHELIEQLIDEVAQMPGALPLLSFALSELYLKLAKRYLDAQNRGEIVDRAITQDDYDELGGVTRSLTQSADREYEDLVKEDPAYEQTIRHVMLRMVAVGGELARRRVYDSELEYPQPENDRVKKVIKRFEDARLLTSDKDDNDSYVEPAHDVLVRGWNKLQDWINQEQKQGNLALQRVLNSQAEAWKERGYLRGDLWTKNSRLKLLQDILEKPDRNWFNQLEEKFVKRSVWQKQADNFTFWTGLTAIFLGLASAATYFYIQLQRTELREKATRVENLLTTNPVDALVLAIEANGKSQSILKPFLEFDLVQSNLLKALEISKEKNLLKWHNWQQYEGTVSQLTISSNNQTIVSVDDRNRVRIWNLEGQPLAELPKTTENLISSVAITSDGQTIVTANENGKLSLWSRDGQLLKEIFHQQRGLLFGTVVTISPDGEIIASGGYDGTLKLWDRDGKLVCNPKNHSKSVSGIRINDNNQIINLDRDGIVQQWDKHCQILASNKLQQHQGYLGRVAMSANGEYIVGWNGGNSDDNSGEITVWNKEGKLIWKKQDPYNNKQKTTTSNYDFLTALSISNDGQIITTGSFQGQIKIWYKLESNYQKIDDLPASHIGQITSLDISSNKNIIISGGYDGTIRIWDNNQDFLGIGQPLKIQEQNITSVAASKDSEIIVSSDGDNPKLIIWRNHQPKKIFQGFNNFIDVYMPVAISYDGQVIVSGHNDGIIRVWNQQGQLQKEISENQNQSKSGINSLAISKDSKTIVSSHDDGCVRIWKLTGQIIGKSCKYQVNSVDISADGQIITIGFDGGIQLLNRSGQTIWKYSPLKNEVFSVKISADGNTIIGRVSGDLIYFWDRQGKLINSEPLNIQNYADRAKGHESVLNAIALSPDGQLIATDGIESTIWLWNRKNQLIAKGRWWHNNRISSMTFTPDGQYIVTGSREGEIRLWRGGWKTWLEVACNRLKYHPVLTNPQTETAKNALNTCQKYVWQTKLGSTQ